MGEVYLDDAERGIAAHARMNASNGIADGVGRTDEMLAAIGALGEWLGFSASCIKSGEAWSPTCETMRSDARAALTTLSRLAAPAEVDARVEAMRAAVLKAVAERRAIYETKQEEAGWSPSIYNEWDRLEHTLAALDWLKGEIVVALSAQPTGGQ